MFGQKPPKPARADGTIDFELTDFDDARQAMDKLPPGVVEARQLQTGAWAQVRRKTTATDRALTGQAMDWVIGLPADLRPYTVCEQYPRIINDIAAAWTDTPRCLHILDHMINDYRGGRRGFPEPVQRELAALFAQQVARSGRG